MAIVIVDVGGLNNRKRVHWSHAYRVFHSARALQYVYTPRAASCSEGAEKRGTIAMEPFLLSVAITTPLVGGHRTWPRRICRLHPRGNVCHSKERGKRKTIPATYSPPCESFPAVFTSRLSVQLALLVDFNLALVIAADQLLLRREEQGKGHRRGSPQIL